MRRQLGEQAWRWNPSDLALTGHLAALLDIDGIDFALSNIGNDAVLMVISDHGFTVNPGDWVARTPHGHWRVLRYPTQEAYDAACAALWRHRGTVERVLELHARTTATGHASIPVDELTRALQDDNPLHHTNQEGTRQ